MDVLHEFVGEVSNSILLIVVSWINPYNGGIGVHFIGPFLVQHANTSSRLNYVQLFWEYKATAGWGTILNIWLTVFKEIEGVTIV